MTQPQQEPGKRSRNRAGGHAADLLSSEQVAEALQDELRSVGNWVLEVLNAQLGWDRMDVDLKPQGGRVWLRITEHRGEHTLPGTVGPIKPGSPILRRISRLQSLAYRPGRGTWLSTVVTVTAEGWPRPTYSFAAQHNFDERPPTLGEEGPYGIEEGIEHLEAFPRTEARVPTWLSAMAGDSDQVIPVLPPGTEQEADPDGTVNPRLREAVAEFAAAPSEEGLIEVLRQCTAGDLLVDATGSDLVRGPNQEITGDSVIRLQSFAEADGTRSLAAYTAQREARNMFDRSGQEGDPVFLRQRATAILELVGADRQYDHLIIDAGAASCRIPREQIDWLLSSPRNDVAKNGLAIGSVPQVLSGMVGPNSVLLLGVRPVTGNGDRAADGSANEPEGAAPAAATTSDVEPVWAKPEEGQVADTLLLFTSAAEVAALDPGLAIRSAPARDVLRYALGTGARQVCLNARPPVASFSSEDIRDVLESVERSSAQNVEDGVPLPPMAGGLDVDTDPGMLSSDPGLLDADPGQPEVDPGSGFPRG